ncbi:MAG TPA: hypothetical protein VM012_11970 [Flavitalea sp.]|nr:hypothetical protein [Flavitalea sp.]
MKTIKIFLILLCFSNFSIGHPGIGIVQDSKGNVYYTDLTQVWKISRDGNKKVVVPNVHTHELYIDHNDNLYGEHVWYNGERADTWGHYVWKKTPDDKIEKIKGPLPGFLEDYSFIRDSAGNMYWVEKFTVSRFKKRSASGTETIGEGRFRNIRWMSSTRSGVLYFMDIDRLYKLKEGKFALLADHLNESTSPFKIIGEIHNAYGIWTDASENIYVALHGGQRIKKITPTGIITTFLSSPSPWSPTNGLFDKDGNLYLLEYTLKGDARVRMIRKNDFIKNVAIIISPFNHATQAFFAGALAILLFLVSAVFIRFSLHAGAKQKTTDTNHIATIF